MFIRLKCKKNKECCCIETHLCYSEFLYSLGITLKSWKAVGALLQVFVMLGSA